MVELRWKGTVNIVTGSGSIEDSPSYSPNTAYEKGDIVRYGEGFYYCTSNISQMANDEWNSISDMFTPCWHDIIFAESPTQDL